MKVPLIVIKTEEIIKTTVYRVMVEESNRYPTTEDNAITAINSSKPIGSTEVRDLEFMTMPGLQNDNSD